MERTMIELKNVTKTYENGFTALEDISLQIKDGEFVFVVGRSGSGKSTLARLLIREEKPTSGTILVDGQDLGTLKQRKVPYYRRKLGIIFQDFLLFPEKTVYENVAFALRVVGEHSAGIRMKVNAALRMVELSDKSKAYPDQLSGGEQQRVALARALAGGPGILIADEPTGNIDPVQSKEFIELLYRIHSRYQKTVVVLTHEKELAAEFSQRMISISRGKIEEDRPSDLPESTAFFAEDSYLAGMEEVNASAVEETNTAICEEEALPRDTVIPEPITLLEDAAVAVAPVLVSDESAPAECEDGAENSVDCAPAEDRLPDESAEEAFAETAVGDAEAEGSAEAEAEEVSSVSEDVCLSENSQENTADSSDPAVETAASETTNGDAADDSVEEVVE